jgi:hypothetical protein
VASIVAGTGAASGGLYRGVAPSASILNVKVLSNAGFGYSDWIVSGIQWAVDNGADVLSMSFGASMNGDGSDPISVAVDWAADQGAVPVVAAGNSGPGSFSVGIPGVAKEAITVGATTKSNEIAFFSSRGPTSDWRIKPDLLAPGVDIIAARAAGTGMGNPIDDFYTSASGTSMATPHVSGAVALMLQVDPTQKPEQIKARLTNTAQRLSVDVWVQGSGRIDCYLAATMQAKLSPTSWSFGQLTSPAAVSAPISLMNQGALSVSFTIATSTTVGGVEADYVRASVRNGTLDGFQELLFELTAGPFDLNSPEGWFEGWLDLQWQADTIQEVHIPYLLVVASSLEVTVYDTDGSPIEALVTAAAYPDLSSATSLFSTGQGPARMIVESGEHAVFAQLAWIGRTNTYYVDFGRAFALERIVTVPRLSVVSVSFSLADAKASSIPTRDSEGHDLIVHSYLQMLSGGTPTWDDYWQSNFMEWGTSSAWFGFDLTIGELTFYSTTFDPGDKVSLNLGFYASDLLHSQVYLMPFKFWNVASIPTTIAYPSDQLAIWSVLFDVPEVFPSNGLRIMNAFWFTWDYTGTGFQLWAWDTHEIYEGTRSQYVLAPNIQWPFLFYMPTYGVHDLGYMGGPLQEIHINDWRYPIVPEPGNQPPGAGEVGSTDAGAFEFAPYTPGFALSASQGQVHLIGDVWRGVTWPRFDWYTYSSCGVEGPVSPYPQQHPGYELRVDGSVADRGELTGGKYVSCPQNELVGAGWTDIDKSWEIAGGEVVFSTTMPAMGLLSSRSSYSAKLDLSSGDPDAPEIVSLIYPRSYVLGQENQVSIDARDYASGIASVEVLFSYDGTTWTATSYEAGIARFVVERDETDSIDLLVRVRDNSGNYAEFINRPAMLNGKIVLQVQHPDAVPPSGAALIGGSLSTAEREPIHGAALRLSSESTSYYVAVKYGVVSQFSLTAPPISGSTLEGELTFLPVGLYSGDSTVFSIKIEPQTSVMVYARRTDGSGIGGVNITLGGVTKRTDSSGRADFSVNAGTYVLSVESLLTRPDVQYVFTGWDDGNTKNPREIAVAASATYAATYKTQNLQIEFSVKAKTIFGADLPGVRIKVDKKYGTTPFSLELRGPHKFTAPSTTSVGRVKYYFAGWEDWSGIIISSSKSITYDVQSRRSLSAVYGPREYSLTVEAKDGTTGSRIPGATVEVTQLGHTYTAVTNSRGKAIIRGIYAGQPFDLKITVNGVVRYERMLTITKNTTHRAYIT